MTYEEIIKFHGHECPGITIGYRMTKAVMDKLSSERSEDEELVAIVENDACGVDALQCITGCTFGKGNLKFRDYGKQVYTIYSRESGWGYRVLFNANKISDSVREDRKNYCKWLLKTPFQEFLSIKKVSIKEPDYARIHQSMNCDSCGESVMETRIKKYDAKNLCIPCYEQEIK